MTESAKVAVQETNDSSIVSKCSTARSGYWRDDFVGSFVAKRSRRSALIHRGYYIRAAAMHHLVENFLRRYGQQESQIISLGAGFDTTYFQLKSRGHLTNTVYYEVDFAEVVCRKRDLILRNDSLLQVFSTPPASAADEDSKIVLQSVGYKLIAANLVKLDELSSCLSDAGIKHQVPTLILSEVVLAYLSPESATDVISWASDTFQQAVFGAYEQILPHDAFGSFMLSHFRKLGAPLRSITAYPTAKSQVERYVRAGWHACVAVDMNFLYHCILSRLDRHRVETLELFDEFEEWHLKCAHYVLITAFATSTASLSHDLWPTNDGVGHFCSSFAPGFLQDSSVQIPSLSVEHKSSAEECSPFRMSNDSEAAPSSASFDETRLKSGIGYDKDVSNCKHIGIDQQYPKNVDICLCSSMTKTISSAKNSTISSLHIGKHGCMSSLKRYGHSSLRISEDLVITIGGFGACNRRHMRLPQPVAYSLKTRAEVNVRMTFASDKHEDVLARMYHSLVRVGDSDMIVYGGRTSPSKPCGDMLLLHCHLPGDVGTSPGPAAAAPQSTNNQTDVQLSCKCSRLPQGGATPAPRWRHTAVMTNYNGSRQMFIFGGRNDKEPAMNDLHSYDIATSTWSQLQCSGDGPEARHSHTMDEWCSSLIVCCGLSSDLRPMNSVHWLDLCTMTWSKFTVNGHLEPRYSHTSAVSCDQLLLIGGVSLRCSPGVTAINLLSGVCQQYELPHSCDLSPVMFHNHQSVPLSTCEHLTLGGGGNCFSFGTHLNSTPLVITLPNQKDE